MKSVFRLHKYYRSVLAVLVMLFFSSNNYGQITEIFYSTADAFITEVAPDNNFGNGTTLIIGKDLNGDVYVPLIKFDLSSIPGNAIIEKATLTLTRWPTAESDEVEGAAWRLLTNWNESTITWTTLMSYDNSTGGTISTTGNESSISISASSVVRKWVEDGYSNYGFALVPSSWSINGNTWGFYSREKAGTDSDPKLTVIYSVPVDITVQNQSVSPTTICAGSAINVTCDHYCIGGSDATPNVGYYLSTDSNCTTSDIFLGDDGSSICGNDTDDPEGATLTIPSNTSPGTYYICFIGDYLDEVSETDESNNCEYIQITVSSEPSQPSPIGGNESPCTGVSEQYSVTNVPGVTYSWTATNGSISGTGNSIYVTWNSKGNQTLTVTPSNSCGSGPVRILTVNIGSKPNQPSAINGNQSPCTGVSEQYSVTNVSGVTYNWYATNGSISGTGNSIYVTWNAKGNQTLTVTPSNNCGSGTVRTLDVVVNSKPDQPSPIEGKQNPHKGDKEAYSVENVDGVSYSWAATNGTITENNGHAINVTWDAIEDTKLSVTPSNVCNSGEVRVLDIDISIVSVENSANNDVSIYPNPANNKLFVTNLNHETIISIYSISGQKLKEARTSSKDIEINIVELDSGIYMIKLIDKNGTSLHKFIKQ